MMDPVALAKPQFDVGIYTNNLDPMLAFWQGEVGVPFDHALKVKRGQVQHRHDWRGSVIKINHMRDEIPARPAGGYRTVLLASDTDSLLTDPDGNKIELRRDIGQLGLVVKVRDMQAHADFYKRAFGFAECDHPSGLGFVVGDSRLLLEQSDDAPSDASGDGVGIRYITFQIFKCDEAHARALDAGGREAWAPITLGETARISMVRDPDGNWIELSQRANLVGTLD